MSESLEKQARQALQRIQLTRRNSKREDPPSTEPEQSHLFALDCRGTLEPVLLLLEDGCHPYSIETISTERWKEMQATGEDRPPRFPFSALPVLEQGYAHDGRTNRFTEVSAILRYFAATLRSPDMSPLPAIPIAEARHNQILEASLAFTSRFLDAGNDAEWLEEDHLRRLWQDTAEPFLHSLECILQDIIMPPLVAPELPKSDARPGTLLSAASVASAYAVELVASLYGRDTIARRFKECTRLRDSVYERERVAAWLDKSGQLKRDWNASSFATFDLVREAARHLQEGTFRLDSAGGARAHIARN